MAVKTLEIGETLYSQSLVESFVKDMYHCRSSQFWCSEAVREDWYLRAYAYIRTSDAELAMQIVQRHQHEDAIMKYGTPLSMEFKSDNHLGDYWIFKFGFWLDS